MTIGGKIKKYRKDRGLSKEELAKRLLVSVEMIESWENDSAEPALDNLLKLKEVFGVSVDELVSGEERSVNTKNSNSLDTVCASLAYAMGIEPPAHAARKNVDLADYIDRVFEGKKADRVVMYNTDAVAQWIYEKYPWFFRDVKKYTEAEVPLASVMPSVTPVCFGTMYTGAQPSVHGIQKYEKPIITIDTIFDALIRAGKRIAIITYGKCSMSRIFLGRDLDYYHYEEGGIVDVNAKAMEVLSRDEHDFVVIYNGNYDGIMHKKGPESVEALAELRLNGHMFSCISEYIKNNWKHHNTLVGYAMDHGCHEIDGGCGSHGLSMLEDINIVHLYKGYPKTI